MKFIGLLMVSHEDDILEAVVAAHEEIVDVFYVLDGTTPNDVSRRICEASPKCGGYLTDAELPRPPYTEKPVCGYRQSLYEAAVADHGWDNWFLILHGDEVWTCDPRDIVEDGHDGYWFQLPFYFPRDGEEWDNATHPLDQLRWRLGPGFPEFRMFKGGPNVRYSETQTYDTKPSGVVGDGRCVAPIKHYLYRSPDEQRARAARHVETGFDPDNYRHITARDEVYWDDEMIARYQQQDCWRDLACDGVLA
ncbi:MAG: hypothetical protein V7647_802 [Acidobacteriota bacterium]|jgi:hypothetical protein